MKYFDPESMSVDGRKEFMLWYENQKGKDYNMFEELLAYCKSDVTILRRCCVLFALAFESILKVNPFEKSATMASACSRVYRQNFMKPNTIGVLPPYGYTCDKQSAIGVKWLEWLMRKNPNLFIQHAQNGGEKAIANYKVDGWDERNNVVYSFDGCYFHGCEVCFPNGDTMNQRTGSTMGELRERTAFRRTFLKDRGHTVISKRECEFRAEIKADPELAAFAKDLNISEPLNPREAFFGGRTNAVKLYHKCNENESIKYVDFTSLYPYVNKYKHYPLGHPVVYRGENLQKVDDPLKCEGLIKCKVLPPKQLYFPVLPQRTGNKLKFSLCAKCAETTSKTCDHSDDERALIGTWVIFEVRKAVEKGYRLVKTYEIWDFEQTTQYDFEKKEGGLFTSFINTFLKQKQEASGWPDWCETEEDKKKYIDDYAQHEGITLDRHNIKYNAGMRSTYKAGICALWGKFGQRNNFLKTLYTDSPEVYINKLTDDSIEVTDSQLVNEEFVLLKYREKTEFIEACPYTNCVIAAYTTAHARLKLYEELEKLDQQVLYFDTDSIIYVYDKTNKKHFNPPLGDYLGDFKDELNGASIEEFVSGGPKNYGYRIKESQETVCKVRGFTLNYGNSQKINFETMRCLVQNLNFSDTISVENPYKIRRRKDFKITTVREVKKYGLVYDKRYLTDDFFTLPFGY
ncbi:uncharacterized protein LOC135498397 [Lineus longissimus]|uniref:uncharacterized protein LOC135498397 n=1 Tax=Lineus longissimus TaxID=88925 RepID=UPI00315D4088